MGSRVLRALGSYGHLRMAPPNRRLHEEGHQAASCEARRQKEHWRDRGRPFRSRAGNYSHATLASVSPGECPANFLACRHPPVAPLKDTALIARNHAMVQWEW